MIFSIQHSTSMCLQESAAIQILLECCLPTSDELTGQSAAGSDLKNTNGSDLKPDVASDKMDIDDDLKTSLGRLNLATITGSNMRLTALQAGLDKCCYFR